MPADKGLKLYSNQSLVSLVDIVKFVLNDRVFEEGFPILGYEVILLADIVNQLLYLRRDHILHENSLIIRNTGVVLLQTAKTEHLLFVEGFHSVQLGDELVGERDVEGGDAPRRDQLV